jgi:hypothetical protein
MIWLAEWIGFDFVICVLNNRFPSKGWVGKLIR